MKESKKDDRPILVVVDYQNDFVHPDGALYVPGAEQLREKIVALIKGGAYKRVIFTVDWHWANDFSFKCVGHGGTWPRHCVQHSEGAAIDQAVLEAAIEHMPMYEVFRKGAVCNQEEYGAFVKAVVVEDEKTGPYIAFGNCMYHPADIVSIGTTEEVAVCGVAGDYCVWETYKNLRKAGVKVTPLYDCMRFIGEPFDYEEVYDRSTMSETEKKEAGL